MDLGCNHNYCQQGEDECSQAAREDLLETVWGIRGDERTDLPIAVAKEPPELSSHPVERTHCWVFGAQIPTPCAIPTCLPEQPESVALQFPPLVTLLLCD